MLCEESESSSININFDFENFISDIFVDGPMQCKNRSDIKKSNTVLVNGAPGMGKTTLCKEIAYQWAKGNEILKDIDLIFLLFLRDPKVLKVYTLEELIHYFYDFEPSDSETAKHCASLLKNCNNITIIFDGFDEFCDTNNDLLVTRIINLQVLPQSKIVITSCPFASEILQSQADVKVEMIGFSEQSKIEYIEKELKGDPDKIKKLQLCLERHSDIKGVCYIPIILSVLVFIVKRSDEFPEDQLQLYDHFIRFVISRSRQRLEMDPTIKILPLDELPQNYQDYLLQLSKFAYEHVINKKFVFTEEDVKIVCSNFILADKQFNGLGLLNYTKHTEVSISEVSERVYYNFMHLSVQEYLAAYYISSLESCDQFQLLKNTFFVTRYLNTWIIYLFKICFKEVTLKILWLVFVNLKCYIFKLVIMPYQKIKNIL